MSTVTLSVRALRYVLPHIGTEARRTNLHGVLLEPSGVIVATGGKTLVAHAHAVSNVTRPLVLEFPKLPAKAEELEFTMPVVDDASPVVARVLTSTGLEIERVILRVNGGMFPNWRNVFPSSDAKPVPAVGIDPELLSRFYIKGSKELEAIMLEFFHAESAIRVTYPKRPDVAGLIMPVRVTETPDTGWVMRSAAWEPEPALTRGPSLD
jgi:hypothetical protein